jgi:hypothetical protein
MIITFGSFFWGEKEWLTKKTGKGKIAAQEK